MGQQATHTQHSRRAHHKSQFAREHTQGPPNQGHKTNTGQPRQCAENGGGAQAAHEPARQTPSPSTSNHKYQVKSTTTAPSGGKADSATSGRAAAPLRTRPESTGRAHAHAPTQRSVQPTSTPHITRAPLCTPGRDARAHEGVGREESDMSPPGIADSDSDTSKGPVLTVQGPANQSISRSSNRKG